MDDKPEYILDAANVYGIRKIDKDADRFSFFKDSDGLKAQRLDPDRLVILKTATDAGIVTDDGYEEDVLLVIYYDGKFVGFYSGALMEKCAGIMKAMRCSFDYYFPLEKLGDPEGYPIGLRSGDMLITLAPRKADNGTKAGNETMSKFKFLAEMTNARREG